LARCWCCCDLKETPAQFQERCSQLALAYFWLEQASKEDLMGIQTEINKNIFLAEPIIQKNIETVEKPVEERWLAPAED
jgi:hypothetical protein